MSEDAHTDSAAVPEADHTAGASTSTEADPAAGVTTSIEADHTAEAVAESPETLRVPSVESRSRVHADDGEPISDEMASAAAVAAVVAIRQVATAYAAQQAEAAAESETRKGDLAGFRAPRRNVRRRLPQTWTQKLGR
ncbi:MULTISPECIES: hypothetical protein [unclassified Brevibacterium]|uniref:hypothetical protein n=1 Tax=unclassified Brevibacterium TaxID=2614124 RepID=UPI001F114CB9|nr:hypothetical protein [Brevibacterium sp. S111]